MRLDEPSRRGSEWSKVWRHPSTWSGGEGLYLSLKFEAGVLALPVTSSRRGYAARCGLGWAPRGLRRSVACSGTSVRRVEARRARAEPCCVRLACVASLPALRCLRDALARMASYHARAGMGIGASTGLGPGPLSSTGSRTGRSTSRTPSTSRSSSSSRALAMLRNGAGAMAGALLGSSGGSSLHSGRPKSLGSMYTPTPSPSTRSPYGHHGLVGYGGSGSTGYLALGSMGLSMGLTTYGGTASGYGGLMVPSSSSSSLNRQPSPSRPSNNVLHGNLSISPSGATTSSTSSSFSSSGRSSGRSTASSSSASSNSQTSKQRARARQRSRSTPRSAAAAASMAGAGSSYTSPALSRSGSNSSIVSSARSTTSEGYVVSSHCTPIEISRTVKMGKEGMGAPAIP